MVNNDYDNYCVTQPSYNILLGPDAVDFPKYPIKRKEIAVRYFAHKFYGKSLHYRKEHSKNDFN